MRLLTNGLPTGKLPAAFLLLLVSASFLPAQSRPTGVTGTVLDPSGASAPDSVVTLRQGAANVIASVHTDLDGRFELNGVRPGSYTLEVRHEGFKDSVSQLKISTKVLAPLTITLTLADVSSQMDVSGSDVAEVSTDIASNLDAAAVDQSLL